METGGERRVEPPLAAFRVISSRRSTVPHERDCVVPRFTHIEEEEDLREKGMRQRRERERPANVVLRENVEIAESMLAFFVCESLSSTATFELLRGNEDSIGELLYEENRLTSFPSLLHSPKTRKQSRRQREYRRSILTQDDESVLSS